MPLNVSALKSEVIRLQARLVPGAGPDFGSVGNTFESSSPARTWDRFNQEFKLSLLVIGLAVI